MATKPEHFDSTADTLPMPLTELPAGAVHVVARKTETPALPVTVVTVVEEPVQIAPPVPAPVVCPVVAPAPDPEAIKEERKLRHWVIKIFVSVVALLFVAVVLTMLYVFVVRGDKLEGGIIGSFLEAITEILKVMKTPVPSS